MLSVDQGLDIEPYKINAYSGRVKFDLISKESGENRRAQLAITAADDSRETKLPVEILGDDILVKKAAKREWELDVRGLMPSKRWLQNYGLKRNKIDLDSLLAAVGFRRRDDYDYALRKPVPSKYGDGKFLQKYHPAGKTINITVGKDRVRQLVDQLKQATSLYGRRLEWLTTESRRIFGVVCENVAVIILDIKNLSPQQFDQYRCAAEKVLREQISQIAKFNLIRATEEPTSFRDECAPVTKQSIDEAIDWLWTLNRTTPIAATSTCEAVIKACQDKQGPAVYLFTEGSSSASSLELLLENVKRSNKSLHVVSYNCSSSDVLKALRNLSEITGGRFHAYGVLMEMDTYDPLPVEDTANRANIVLRKKTYGGVPPGAGVREDVILVFEELEEARSNLAQMEGVLASLPDSKPGQPPSAMTAAEPAAADAEARSEDYLSSAAWLAINGLTKNKLRFHDAVAKVAFRHCDGVVGIKERPADDEYKTDANTREKLVGARYCDQFAHVSWKDGSIMHVQVTPEVHRTYADKVGVLLDRISVRIKWLQQGSRALFGTVVEDQLYILLDTSGSMSPSMQFLKDKLFLLFQEQIRHKKKFNIVAFNSIVCPWRDRLVDVSEANLKEAWLWVQGLDCGGSTNTLGALQYALSDPQTQGVYLLTDGRPDHPPKSVLAQVSLKTPVPVHAISFNCADATANRFLCQLAKDTGGRYHYFSECGLDPEGPEAWQSEDIRLLAEERERGAQDLSRLEQLRDECNELQWKSSRAGELRLQYVAPPDPRPSLALDRPRSSLTLRARPAPTLHPSSSAPTLSLTAARRAASGSYRYVPGGRSGDGRSAASVASHTKTSLLRTMSAGGLFAADWMQTESRRSTERPYAAAAAAGGGERSDARDRRARGAASAAGGRSRSTGFKSSKLWLSANGLRARKLTLLDALLPVIAKDSAAGGYPVDALLVSRLIDEELSVTPRRKDAKLSLVNNPSLLGVLSKYEAAVAEAAGTYKRRLNQIVWKALPDDSKKKVAGVAADASNPPDFTANKLSMLSALDEAGWPVRLRDVTLLEEEIKVAASYLEQSSRLREAAASATAAAADQVSAVGHVDEPSGRGTVGGDDRGDATSSSSPGEVTDDAAAP